MCLAGNSQHNLFCARQKAGTNFIGLKCVNALLSANDIVIKQVCITSDVIC